jgi:hypothetical protein
LPRIVITSAAISTIIANRPPSFAIREPIFFDGLDDDDVVQRRLRVQYPNAAHE